MNAETKGKIDELLKASGIQELDLDNLSSVSGGGEPTVQVMGASMTKSEFNELVYAVAAQKGEVAAILFFCDLLGRKPKFFEVNRTFNNKAYEAPEGFLKKELDYFWDQQK